jgi:hypothetical protein
MAKKLIRTYTFAPVAKTVTVDGFVNLTNLILITNATSNIIIYNFADSTYSGSTTYSSTTNKTTITLAYPTGTMNANDRLMIYVDDITNTTRPEEVFTDPVDKARVSQPQALIDTDFEYGTQISKWENLTMTNNRPFAFAVPTQIPNVTGMTMNTNSRTVTVNVSGGTIPANGTPIVIQDSYLLIANGTYIIESGGGTATGFTYTAKALNTTSITSIFDANKTNIFRGQTYTGARIGGAPTSMVSGTTANVVVVTTTVPHGLSIGNEIAITGTTVSAGTAPNGSFVVTNISSPTVFSYYTPTALTGTITATSAFVYPRPQGAVLHRPFDGGVMFSSNGSSNYEETVRQTRRYFRYQSGKGIQVSSGTVLKPSLQIDSLTSSGTLVTVITKEQHNILPGDSVLISGADEAAYNGTFTVTGVLSFNTFTYTAGSTPSNATASGAYFCSVVGWYGATNRLGIFDQQNGLFFEFDGQTLYAVQRKSTFQISGEVSVTNGSNTVTQTNAAFPTIFSKQLAIGDYVVIRGVSYRVDGIASDTSMTISPSYRGTTANFAIVSKTQEIRVPQSAWNLDTMDGNGPSGFNLDISKMQMYFIDYSWYGAGTVRWGLRGMDGRVTYVHKTPNNNLNYEAYLRSGNLPARYESSTRPPYTFLSGTTLTSVATTMNVNSTTGFPSSGTICVRNGTNYEYMNYTGVTATAFNGLTRGQAGGTTNVTMAIGSNTGTVASATGLQVGQRVLTTTNSYPDGTFLTNISGTSITLSQAALTLNPTSVYFSPMGNVATGFTYSATAPTMVELAYPTFAPSISHWGTSVIMDGTFDDDKSLLFTYGQNISTNLATGATVALLSIRVSPSVDNGIPAAFGARELINRMQLVLRTLDISLNYTGSTTPNILIRANLNGAPSSGVTWTNAVGNVTSAVNSSLAQIADYGGGAVTVSGGESTGGFFVNGTSTTDLSLVRDLGNSILGGGGAAANTNIFPDGPDVITITATNVGTITANVLSRISWTEAQA